MKSGARRTAALRQQRTRRFGRGVGAAITLLVTALLGADGSIVEAGERGAEGRRLTLRATASGTKVRLVLRDQLFVAPLPLPAGGVSLRLTGGSGLASCTIHVAFDPQSWQPIRGNGPQRGYRYDRADDSGHWRVRLRPGKLVFVGTAVNCDLPTPQDAPVDVRVLVGGDHLCSSFGGLLRRNEPEAYVAVRAPAPAACPAPEKADVTLANINLLHGSACPAESDNCRLPERVDLLFDWIASAGCPDVVALQEVTPAAASLILSGAATACPFPYAASYQPRNFADDQVVLSRFPIVRQASVLLYGFFRSVSLARIDHPTGPLDVFTTHLVSGADGIFGSGDDPCGGLFSCPPECAALGPLSKRECQTVQMLAFVNQQHDMAMPALVAGDMNDPPTGPSYGRMTAAGWIDSHLAAGNGECLPSGAAGCTGVRSASLADLESTAPGNGRVRVDYAFVVPPATPGACSASIEASGDPDGDGVASGVFAAAANPFAPNCGPSPNPICWVSDHNGTQVDLHCD